MINENTDQNNNDKTSIDSAGDQKSREKRLEQILSELPSYEVPKKYTPPSEYNASPPPTAHKKGKSVGKKVAIILSILLVVSTASAFAWYYWETTFASFEYTLQPVVILAGENVSPRDFFTADDNMQNIEAEFSGQVSAPIPGLQGIPLTLNYGLRTLNTIGTLYVLSSAIEITHEFQAEADPLSSIDFITNTDIASTASFDLQFTEQPLPLSEYPVGTHTLHLTLNEVPFVVTLHVVD